LANSSSDLTLLLGELGSGGDEVFTKLLPKVYGELRTLAARYMRREEAGHSLQTTALVHEAYLRLVTQKNMQFPSRMHFFAAMSKIIRNILVNHAVARSRLKRGGQRKRLMLYDSLAITPERKLDLLALDEALTRLAKRDKRACQIVELRYFGGMTSEETADYLGVSSSTVNQTWRWARAWLFKEIYDD